MYCICFKQLEDTCNIFMVLINIGIGKQGWPSGGSTGLQLNVSQVWSGPGIIFVLILVFVPNFFFLWVCQFFSLNKNQHSKKVKLKFNMEVVNQKEPLQCECANCKFPFIVFYSILLHSFYYIASLNLFQACFFLNCLSWVHCDDLHWLKMYFPQFKYMSFIYSYHTLSSTDI